METCKICGKEFKRLGVHMRTKHLEGNSSSAPKESLKDMNPIIHKFFSPRAKELVVVIEPTRQGFINTQAGSMSTMIEGKRVAFQDGYLSTSDPEVITYIKAKYKDRSYPIVDLTETEEIAKTQLGV